MCGKFASCKLALLRGRSKNIFREWSEKHFDSFKTWRNTLEVQVLESNTWLQQLESSAMLAFLIANDLNQSHLKLDHNCTVLPLMYSSNRLVHIGSNCRDRAETYANCNPWKNEITFQTTPILENSADQQYLFFLAALSQIETVRCFNEISWNHGTLAWQRA
jgi:hypothetical protein